MNAHQPAPSPACARFAGLLPLLDEPDDNPRVAAARTHLAGCEYCQAEKRRYDRLDHILRQRYGLSSIRQHATEEIMRSILNRPDHTDHPERLRNASTGVSRRPFFLRRSWLAGLGPVAAVLVLVGLAVALFGGRLGFGPAGSYGPPRYSFPGTTGSIASISMVSPDEGWALGQVLKDQGGSHPTTQVALYHYINGAWTPVYVPTSQDVAEGGISGFNGTISMDSASDGWAVAHNFNRFSIALHYSNGTWSQVDAPTIGTLQALSPRSVWAISGLLPPIYTGQPTGIVHYDGTRWVQQTITGVTFNQTGGVIDLHMVSDHEGWALADWNDGNSVQTHYAVLHYTGGVWSVYTSFSEGDFSDFSSLAMVSPNEGWVIGEKIVPDSHGQTTHVPLQMLVYHYLNGHWTSTSLTVGNSILPYATLKRIVMLSPSDGWIVGTQQRTYVGSTTNDFEQQAILFHYSGGRWTQVQAPSTGTPVNEITGLAFTSDGQGWACGYASDIPASQVVQDTDILAKASPEMWTYQNGTWTLYQKG